MVSIAYSPTTNFSDNGFHEFRFWRTVSCGHWVCGDRTRESPSGNPTRIGFLEAGVSDDPAVSGRRRYLKVKVSLEGCRFRVQQIYSGYQVPECWLEAFSPLLPQPCNRTANASSIKSVKDQSNRHENNGALYEERSVKEVPPEYLDHHLTGLPAVYFAIKPATAKLVEIEHLNLNDPLAMRAMRQFDFDVCRNVPSYSDRRLAQGSGATESGLRRSANRYHFHPSQGTGQAKGIQRRRQSISCQAGGGQAHGRELEDVAGG